MKTVKYSATLMLAAVTAGYFISYPYSSSFSGGLINSSCWAAMVGGLADWFAVTALFRKPLGISFRTAIIPRNRERILKDLVCLVEQDLLTGENIIKTLANYNLADLVISYLEKEQVRRGIKELSHRLMQDMLAKVDTNDMGRFIEGLIKENAAQIKVSPVLIQALGWTLKNGYDEKIITFLLGELSDIVSSRQMRTALIMLFENVTQAYEKDMAGRTFVNLLLDISPDKLADYAQQELVSLLKKLWNPDQAVRLKLKAWLEGLVIQFNADSKLQNKVEQWKNSAIASRLNIQAQISCYITYLREAAATHGGENANWLNHMDSLIDKLIAGFKDSYGQQAIVDSWLKSRLEAALDQYHGYVALIVKERLNEFTDKLLVEFIESKVGNDLQFIRINGAIIGGLAGTAIYLLSYLAERLW